MTNLIREYLSTLHARRLSRQTVATYGHALRAFGVFTKERGPSRIQDTTLSELEAWERSLIQRQLAPCSLEVYLRAARQFFRWLESTQRVFLNPAERLVVPRAKRRLLPVPTEEEMNHLLAQPNIESALGLRDRALLETAYATGARREEMARLDIVALDLEDRSLRLLGKGQKERIVPLSSPAASWLARYLSEGRPSLARLNPQEPALWLNAKGTRLGYFGFQRLVRRHAKEAGLSTALTFHGIRRACATHMLRRGAHPAQIQLLLGHGSLKTLGQYLSVTITDLLETHAHTQPGQ